MTVPFTVPCGVLHTPHRMGHMLNPWDKTRGTPWDTFTENPVNSRLLAVPLFKYEWDTVGHLLSHFQKTRGTPAKSRNDKQ